MSDQTTTPTGGTSPILPGRLGSLREIAYGVVILAGSWYMLGQLEMVLRPLLLAIFLGYVLLPTYNRLRKHVPVPLALGVLVGLTSLLLLGLTAAVTVSLLDLTEQGPELKRRSVNLIRRVGEIIESLPVIGPAQEGAKPLEKQMAERLTESALRLVNVAALGLPEAFAAGLYLLFLMLEAGKFPNRVRQAYSGNQADEILQIFGRINSAVIGYLKAKVNSSLVLALPVGLVLGIFGVKFAILWTVLTFACNFIPYVGSIVAYCLPVSFAFLQLESTSTVIVLSVLVLSWHVASAAVIEPMMVGKAVGLSPLVILAALSMWGLLWGLPGMFLAVPLTVVGKIVLENIPMMRAVAQLAGEESKKPS